MIIFKFVLKTYCNLNILILKFCIKKSQEILCLSYEYELSIINIYIKIYYLYMSMSLKSSYISYKINKMIVLIHLPKNIVNKQDVLF